MYSEKESTPRIIEAKDNGLKPDLDLEDGLVDPHLEL